MGCKKDSGRVYISMAGTVKVYDCQELKKKSDLKDGKKSVEVPSVYLRGLNS